jgi:hypothetical protein
MKRKAGLMMYLTEVSMWSVVKKQLRFKLKSYRGVFTSLIWLQLLAISFSMGGEASSGGGSQNFSYDLRYYTGNMILAFMMIWAFISAVIVTTQAYRYDDFTFVGNRLSSHLANSMFLSLASVVGGITVLLASQLMKIIVMFFQDREYIASAPLTFSQFSLGMAAMILYIFLFAALGYLTGTLIQISKVFIVILPALFFGGLIVHGMLTQQSTLLLNIGGFFFSEPSFLVLFLKVLLVSSLAFGASMLISNRMEVRK